MRRPALALLLGCLLLVAGASALDGYDYYQTIEYAACDQETYQQDIVVHRTTGTAYNETAGGLETWHIYVGEHCREDYGDVRFTNSTGELEYYLWPDYDSSSARVCVRLGGATSAGAVTIHYGNPSATTTSDGDATYLLHDHFDGASIDTTKWTVRNTVVIESGAAKAGSTVTRGDLIASLQSFGSGTMCQIRGKFDRGGYAADMGFWLSSPQTVAAVQADSSKIYADVRDSGYSVASGSLTTSTEYNLWQITQTGDSVVYALNGATVATITSRVPSRDMPVRVNGYAAGAYAYADWVLVRAYSATPPAATTFSGEQETTAPPVTAFTTNTTAGLAPLAVQFTDTSAGTPTAWSWSFGDGNTSITQNPQHTYTVPGTYTVTLTATNEYGSDYELKTDYITVYGPVTAQFSASPTGGTAPLSVTFTDTSAGGPTSWSWTFGDGNTSTAQNPQHTYTTAGAHTITLTASHPYDSDTETKTSYIIVAVLQPFPGLTALPRDLNSDGLYTDINGNNRLDYNDLTIFFQNLAWAKTAQPIACFDFNGNGWLDYNDVITLFSTIMEEHT